MPVVKGLKNGFKQSELQDHLDRSAQSAVKVNIFTDIYLLVACSALLFHVS